MSTVFSQVRGDAVGACICGNMRSPHWIGMITATRVPYSRDMVDIDAETEFTGHAAARLPGFTAGIDASSAGSSSASYVGTSIRISG